MTRRLAIGTAGIVTLLGLLFAPQGPLGGLWPEPAHVMEPIGFQLPLIMTLGLIEAITMGIGVAFLLFGWQYTKRLFDGRTGLAALVHVSVAWMVGSWWIHDNLHMVLDNQNLWTLLGIEYGFHVTLMVAGVVIAAGIYVLGRDADGAPAEDPSSAGGKSVSPTAD